MNKKTNNLQLPAKDSNIHTRLMNKKLNLLAALLFLLAQTSFAQLSKTLHQSFEIDSLNQISLDLHGDVEIAFWEGNTVLTETKVDLYDATQNIFKHFLQVGRYKVELNESAKLGGLKHIDKVRKPIFTSEGQCWEAIELTVFLPDTFKKVDDKNYKRQTEAELAAEKK